MKIDERSNLLKDVKIPSETKHKFFSQRKKNEDEIEVSSEIDQGGNPSQRDLSFENSNEIPSYQKNDSKKKKNSKSKAKKQAIKPK
jgi:hypothetical protein